MDEFLLNKDCDELLGIALELRFKLEQSLEENANLRGIVGELEEKLESLDYENYGLREVISSLMEELNYKED